MDNKQAWLKYSEAERKELDFLCKGYIDFLSSHKSEREFAKGSIECAENAGYKSLDEAIKNNEALKPGDKVWACHKNKAVALVQIGKNNIEEGMNILGAHIDSPRLDIKQNPLYEKCEFAMMDTHYYGGIKKYQWVTLPLAIHGVIALKNGETINVVVGEDENDPVFCVPDILIHLGKEQLKKNADSVIEGEDLDILVGNETTKELKDDKEVKNAIKQHTLNLLKEKYGIEEEDFLSAELEVFPAGRAREMGFDRSMILAYGQDDKVCAYPSLLAQLNVATNVEVPERTCVCFLSDKEEIGSVGASGMQSAFFENTIAEICKLLGKDDAISAKRALSNSKMLSSDVNAGVDPLYESVFEEKNASFCGRGLVFSKFTGSRGKSGSNDANAEFVAEIRKIMDDSNITYQFAELGKVDAGGGGTIAYITANMGMDVIDSGVAVLSMHSPWEVTSKCDIYEAYRGYLAFLQKAGL